MRVRNEGYAMVAYYHPIPIENQVSGFRSYEESSVNQFLNNAIPE